MLEIVVDCPVRYQPASLRTANGTMKPYVSRKDSGNECSAHESALKAYWDVALCSGPNTVNVRQGRCRRVHLIHSSFYEPHVQGVEQSKIRDNTEPELLLLMSDLIFSGAYVNPISLLMNSSLKSPP